MSRRSANKTSSPMKPIEIKVEEEEYEEKPVIIETFAIKQEKEEEYEISLPPDDDDYGEIEVLDEFYEEVMLQVPKKEEAETQPSVKIINIRANVKAKPEPKNQQQPERPFKCKKCPLAFKTSSQIIEHRRIHKKSNFHCKKCNQKFRFQASYINHDCDFWCNICGKSISNKANLKIHLSYVHNIGSAKIFTCDLCGRFYKSKRNIDTHMKIHMLLTPFNCGICGKGFSHAGALKIHMWNHRDVVNCEFCHKKFKPRSLYYHIKKCPMNPEANIHATCSVTADEVKFAEIIKYENSKKIVVIKMRK